VAFSVYVFGVAVDAVMQPAAALGPEVVAALRQ